MSQIFRPRANALAKLSLFGGALFAAFIGWALYVLQRSDFVTGANSSIEQPVQFSHTHHVGGLGIDCRYCHTTVEESSFANIPPTKTCMNCHSQIWLTSPFLEPVRSSFRDNKPLQWWRVNNLPDFVYFNHSIHVKKGVGCETCHGRLDQMPAVYQARSLQMEWCLDCHRDPSRYIRPREFVTTMGYESPEPQRVVGARLMKEYKIDGPRRLTSCSTCHR